MTVTFVPNLRIHLTKLDADVAAADNDKAFRHFRQATEPRSRTDTAAERECFQLDRTRACRDNAIFETVTRRFLVVEDACLSAR